MSILSFGDSKLVHSLKVKNMNEWLELICIFESIWLWDSGNLCFAIFTNFICKAKKIAAVRVYIKTKILHMKTKIKVKKWNSMHKIYPYISNCIGYYFTDHHHSCALCSLAVILVFDSRWEMMEWLVFNIHCFID